MVHEDLIAAVREQIDSPDTPFVRSTRQHLVGEHSIAPDEAEEMIAHCLADELDAMANDHRSFDIDRYKLLLSLLPSLPEA